MSKVDPDPCDICTIPFIIEDIVTNLESLAVTISEDIESHKRLALEAMIVINVHHRDSAQLILEQNLTSELDFEWRKYYLFSLLKIIIFHFIFTSINSIMVRDNSIPYLFF